MAARRVLLFGTYFGISQSFPFLPESSLAGVISPSIRSDEVNKIKIFCAERNVKVLEQPAKKSELFPRFCDQIRDMKPDMILCNSYSMHIPREVLEIVNYHAINIHWSLLPKNQGPNPVQWAIIKGEDITGVTFHLMEDKIDAGDIIFQESVSIDESDTWVTLADKLTLLSVRMHRKYLPSLLNGNFSKTKQSRELISVNKRLDADYPKIDFSRMSNRQIYDLIRAQVSPLKGAYVEERDGTREYFDQVMTIQQIASLRKRYAN